MSVEWKSFSHSPARLSSGAMIIQQDTKSTPPLCSVVTRVTDRLRQAAYVSRNEEHALARFLEMLGATSPKETVGRMKNTEGIDQLIRRRWPQLKAKVQNEENPDKLIAILEEIDDLLFMIETRIAGQSRPTSATETNSRSLQRELGIVPSDDQEIGSQ